MEQREKDRDASVPGPEEEAPAGTTEADRIAETRRAEQVQQSGEGIRGYGTDGREDQGSEEAIERATEGKEGREGEE